MPTLINTPIGIVLPIRAGPMSGYFDQSFDSFTQYKMNITNLLRTVPGERRMNPNFGCRLWTVAFDQNDDLINEKVNNIINEDISMWVPGVTVNNVTTQYYNTSDINMAKDMLQLYIVLQFTIISINQSDVLKIYLNSGQVS